MGELARGFEEVEEQEEEDRSEGSSVGALTTNTPAVRACRLGLYRVRLCALGLP